MHAVTRDGARAGLEQVVPSHESFDAMLSQANKAASEWAQEHAAALIQGLSDTTTARVRELVDQALADGWSNDDLADALDEDGVFGADRAETIARTETAAADVQGSLAGWEASGVVAQKEWLTGAGCCDLCTDLNGERVDLDDEFPEGDPPLHPNCRCDVSPVVDEGEGE